MKLQRYEPHIYRSLLEESRILFEASDTGEWVKADEALAEIARLRAALKCIFNEVTTGPYYPFSDVGVIAREALKETI